VLQHCLVDDGKGTWPPHDITLHGPAHPKLILGYSILLLTSKMVTATAREENGEFCIAVAPVTRTDILT